MRAPLRRSAVSADRPSGTGVKQRASEIASAPATSPREPPTAAGGSFQGEAFQFVNVNTLVTSVHAIQTPDSVLSSAAAVVAVRPAARAQGRGSRAWAMRPPSSWPAGNRFRAVSSMPIQAAVASGCSAMAYPSRMGPWTSATAACSRAGWPMARAVSSASSGAGADSATPAHSTGSSAAKPASGPAAAMSKAQRRVGGLSRRRMKAPKVPAKVGPGMKSGRETASRWRRAAHQCPNSCVPRIPRMPTANQAPSSGETLWSAVCSSPVIRVR